VWIVSKCPRGSRASTSTQRSCPRCVATSLPLYPPAKASRTGDLKMNLACKYGGGGAAPRVGISYGKAPFATGDLYRERFSLAPVSTLEVGLTPLSALGAMLGTATMVAPHLCLLFLRDADAFTDGTTAARRLARPVQAHLTSGPPLFRGGCGVDAVRLA
jgi:hypothetical protein